MNPKDKNTIQLVDYIRSELIPIYQEREGNAILFALFEGIMNYNQTDIVLKAQTVIPKVEYLKFLEAVEQLKNKTPVQYILGYTDFHNVRIKVDNRVLIPRPETEELVDWIINQHREQSMRILDVGTGSGCISIALKKHLTNSQLIAVDISEDCIKLAMENADLNKVNINFRTQDVLAKGKSDLFAPSESLDLIVSNPPYIEYKDREQMDENILNYEPELALFVKDGNPTVFYEAICELGKVILKRGGYLYYEVNEKYCDEVMCIMSDAGYTRVESKEDIHGKPRMVRGLKE